MQFSYKDTLLKLSCLFSTQLTTTSDSGNHLAAAAKSLQLCLTLCDPIDGSPPCSPVPGVLQARTLEWVAIFFSNAWKWKVKVKLHSRVWLLATPWTAAHEAPPSMGFSRQRVLEWGAIAFSDDTFLVLRKKSPYPCIKSVWFLWLVTRYCIETILANKARKCQVHGTVPKPRFRRSTN